MVGKHVETGIKVLVFEPVHSEVKIIERGELTDESVQFCYCRLRTDDDVVPLVPGSTLLLLSEPIPDGSDLPGDVVVGSFLVFPDRFTSVRPAVRADFVRRIPLEAILVDTVVSEKLRQRDVLRARMPVTRSTRR